MNEGQYQKVASKNDLQEGGLLKVEARGKQIVLSMDGGKIMLLTKSVPVDLKKFLGP